MDDEDDDFEEDCETCDGAGWVSDPSDGGTMTCPDCEGEGKR
jgi:DnaJ-class molecular chaperone